MNIEQYKRLQSLIPSELGWKERYPNYSYLHGLVVGLDLNIDTGLQSRDCDLTYYHALILDDTVPRGPLKDILIGKNSTGVIERFASSNPQAIEEFVQKWVDSSFKLT